MSVIYASKPNVVTDHWRLIVEAYGGICEIYDLCDFYFFCNRPEGHTQTNFRAKLLKRRGSMQGHAFCSKNHDFFKPLTSQTPKTAKIWRF